MHLNSTVNVCIVSQTISSLLEKLLKHPLYLIMLKHFYDFSLIHMKSKSLDNIYILVVCFLPGTGTMTYPSLIPDWLGTVTQDWIV